MRIDVFGLGRIGQKTVYQLPAVFVVPADNLSSMRSNEKLAASVRGFRLTSLCWTGGSDFACDGVTASGPTLERENT